MWNIVALSVRCKIYFVIYRIYHQPKIWIFLKFESIPKRRGNKNWVRDNVLYCQMDCGSQFINLHLITTDKESAAEFDNSSETYAKKWVMRELKKRMPKKWLRCEEEAQEMNTKVDTIYAVVVCSTMEKQGRSNTNDLSSSCVVCYKYCKHNLYGMWNRGSEKGREMKHQWTRT